MASVYCLDEYERYNDFLVISQKVLHKYLHQY